MDTGLKKAIAAKGSIASLARALGITRSAICQWDRIPAERVIDIEKASGVPRAELRPDLFSEPERTSV
jgi:DNA-binding transcriptional regulator YdaS (Cro superfamily)